MANNFERYSSAIPAVLDGGRIALGREDEAPAARRPVRIFHEQPGDRAVRGASAWVRALKRGVERLGQSMTGARWARRRARWSARYILARTWLSTHLPLPPRRGVRFLGYVEGSLGLGHTLRTQIRAYAQYSRRFSIYPFRLGIERRMIGPYLPEHYDLFRRYEVTVLDLATDQLPHLYGHISQMLLRDSYVVLRTFWELPAAPQAWAPLLEPIDEIWVPNSFVGDAFRPIFSGAIHVVPPCVDVTDGPFLERADLGLSPEAFYVLFSFDYHSSTARKNPLAVVRAFTEAFPQTNRDIRLIIKTIGDHTLHQATHDALQQAAEADPRIHIIHQDIPRQQMVSLIRACDCYVSLHRSEGFGSGMAEALLFGRRVVGTNFSGNTDFLTEETGYPVEYDLVPVAPGDYSWSEGQVWAEPRHDSAVAALRAAYFDGPAADARAAAGAALIRSTYGVDAVGAAIAARIETLRAERHALKGSRRG